MATEDNVLYYRDCDTPSSEDVWDDSALIKAYDKAINLAKEEVSKRMGVENQSSDCKQKTKSHKQSGQSQKHQQWVTGSPCRTIYSGDGQLYEAVVTKIFDNSGTCLVTFVGYNNQETVKLTSLLKSDGLQSQIAQQKEAEQVEQPSSSMEFEESSHKRNGYVDNPMDCGTSNAKPFKNMYEPPFNSVFGEMPPAPPLPPQLMARLPENNADALSSMLMSWYISGFHTGYYHGLKQAQGQRKK